jgi:hypothetical protein
MYGSGAAPVPSRVPPLLPAGAVALLSGIPLAGCAGASGDSKPLVAPMRPSSASSERAARAEAASLLRELALPAGAVRAQREPAGDGGVLADPANGSPATPDIIDQTVPTRVGGSGVGARRFWPRFRKSRAILRVWE